MPFVDDGISSPPATSVGKTLLGSNRTAKNYPSMNIDELFAESNRRKAILQRLLTVMEEAVNGSPYRRPAMSAPPTITNPGSTDASLTQVISFAAGGALTSDAVNKIAWYGGVPSPILTQYVAMPVTSVLPSVNGNIGSGFADKNQWASAFEFMTDANLLEIVAYTSSAVKHMFQVDGQYVDFTGTAGTATNNTDTRFQLAFTGRKPRRIRMLVPCLPSKGPTLLKALKIPAGCSVWKPNQNSVLRLGWGGDSYGETTNAQASIYPIPNAAWPVLTGELLGFRDVRQLVVGQTGYISDAGGTRSKLRDQIPRWTAQGPFDAIVLSHGYNDPAGTPAAIAALTAEVLYDLKLIRSLHPNVPIFVFGSQAGNSAPSPDRIAAENAIAGAVAAFADKLCAFIPVSTDTPPWLSSANASLYLDPVDLTHPNLVGSELISYRAAAGILRAARAMLAAA